MNSNVINVVFRGSQTMEPKPPADPPVDGGGSGPHDPGMEARVTKLEAKFEAVLPTLATKADLADVKTEFHKLESSISKWALASLLALLFGGAAMIFASTNLVLNAIKQDRSAQPAQPAAVYIPYPQPPASSPSEKVPSEPAVPPEAKPEG